MKFSKSVQPPLSKKRALCMIGWEITRRCNLTCPHCFSAATRKSFTEFSTQQCFEIIDQLSEFKLRAIGWTGGEPLLRDDLEEIIAYAKKKKIRSGITTNGILVDEKRARNLKKAGVVAMQISVDGSTAERNAVMRNATHEDFCRITEAIRICRKLDFEVSMAMLIGRENLDDAPEYIKWAKREGVECVRFCGFTPWGRGKSEKVKARLSFTQDHDALRQFVESSVRKRKPLVLFDPGFGPLPPKYEYHDCVAGLEWFYLTSTGDVYPCTSLLSKEFRVGNIYEMSIAELWADHKMYRMSDFPKNMIQGHCADCKYFPVCGGACRGATLMHTGDINESFPVCLSRAKL